MEGPVKEQLAIAEEQNDIRKPDNWRKARTLEAELRTKQEEKKKFQNVRVPRAPPR
jgi:hypothetical protein